MGKDASRVSTNNTVIDIYVASASIFLFTCLCLLVVSKKICKMVWMAVAIKPKLLPPDVSPSEVLIMRGNNFALGKWPGKSKKARNSDAAKIRRNNLGSGWNLSFRHIILGIWILDPFKSPGNDWLEALDANTSILESQLAEVRTAWRLWKENFEKYYKLFSIVSFRYTLNLIS